MLSASSTGSDDQSNRKVTRNSLRQMSVDTDLMRRRESINLDHSSTKYLIQDWGIEQHHQPVPEFPDSIQAAAEAAFQAIVGTLNRKQCLDPNLASNAMTKNTITDYRPVRQDRDVGRIGIEIDGAMLLKSELAEHSSRAIYHDSNGSALRELMIVLAGKFAQYPRECTMTESKSDTHLSSLPVALYFNTVKQALAASKQLQAMQNIQRERSLYANVTIHCLGQDDDLPISMRKCKPLVEEERGKDGRKKRGPRKDTTLSPADPVNGVLIVVQPSDYNDEYRPPGPAVGVLASFQKLVARASAEEVPVIMVSPRFLVDDSCSSASWGAGSHQAATYGGSEPPKLPMPWILRDFNPPVYCWVGNAVSLSARDRFEQLRRRHDSLRDDFSHNWNEPKGAYAMIAVTQSVMNEGHPWHVFAGCQPVRTKKHPLQYEYLASTKSAPGRPTRAILKRILSEFGSRS